MSFYAYRDMKSSRLVLISLKNGPNPASFCLFLFFSHDKYSTKFTVRDKSVDGVNGTQTQGGRMVGTDESTEPWWHPKIYDLLLCYTSLLWHLLTEIRLQFCFGSNPDCTNEKWL